MFLRFVGLPALVWAAFALPVLAGDIRCVWNKLPDEVHAKALATYDSDTDDGPPFTEAQIDAAARACGIREEDFQAAGQAIFGLTAQLGAETQLAQVGVTPEDLDKLWRGLDAQKVALMAEGIGAGSEGPRWRETIDAVRDSVGVFQRRLGQRATTKMLIDYVTGRAMQVDFENRG